MSNPWLLNTIPASFDGFPLKVQSVGNQREFQLAEHNAAGLLGGIQESLGAKSRVFPLTCLFGEGEYEAHKIFLNLLDTYALQFKPGLLVHPVYGVQPVFPARYEARTDAAERVAIVEVVFRRHDLTMDVLIPTGPIMLQYFFPATVSMDLSGYLLTLGFLTVLGSQALAAFLAIMSMAGALPSLVTASVVAAGEAFGDWCAGIASQWWESGLLLSDFPDEAVRRAWNIADRVTDQFRTERKMSPSRVAAIIAGDAYDGSAYWNGAPARPGTTPPPPSFHGQLIALATFEAHVAGAVAGGLQAQIVAADRDGALDAVSAEAAVTFARTRLARAVRLLCAAMGPGAVVSTRNLSAVAASLVRSLEYSRMLRRPLTRSFTIENPKPLLLLAEELLGDATRADEIRRLNGAITDDLNRLPRGATIQVPVQ